MYPGCAGVDSRYGRKKSYAFQSMEAFFSRSRFTAAEGGARLAAVAAERNTLAVDYSAFVSTRLLHEDAYKIRGPLSKGFRRSVYVTRASKVPCVTYELNILTDLITLNALECTDVRDWGRELEEKQVIVCTSPVLRWLLQERVLAVPQLNVLIIDSCHLIFEDGDLQYIMECYKQCNESERPRILALTYPLFTSKKDSDSASDVDSKNKSQDDISSGTTATTVNETGSHFKEPQTDNKVFVYKNNYDNKFNAQLEDSKCQMKGADVVVGKVIEICDVTDISDEVEDKCINDSSSNDSGKLEAKISNSEVTKEGKIEGKSLNQKEEKDRFEYNTEADKDITTYEANETIKENCFDNDEEDIRNDKEEVGNDELRGGTVPENVDDFDMYQKLEWKIEQLEEALCCKMDLAEDIDGGKRVANTVAKPKEILIEHSPPPPVESLPDDYVALYNFMRETVASAMVFIDEHRYDPTEIYGDELYEEFMNIPDPTLEPRLIFDHFIHVLETLGPYAADKAAFCLLSKLEKLKIKVPYERHFLLLCLCTTVFVKIRCQADLVLSKYDEWDRIRLFSTPKVLRLAEILEQFQSPEQRAVKEFVNNNRKKKELGESSVNGNVITEVDETGVGDVSRASNDKTRRQIKEEGSLENDGQCERHVDEPISSTDANKSNSENVKSSDNKDYVDRSIIVNEICIDNIAESPKLNDIEDKVQCNNENNSEGIPRGKLTRSKTTDLLNELDNCDFNTLGNKIEDRVNTLEGNLKELDDFDTDVGHHQVTKDIAGTIAKNNDFCDDKLTIESEKSDTSKNDIDLINQENIKFKDKTIHSVEVKKDNRVDEIDSNDQEANRTHANSVEEKGTDNLLTENQKVNVENKAKSNKEGLNQSSETNSKPTPVDSKSKLEPNQPKEFLEASQSNFNPTAIDLKTISDPNLSKPNQSVSAQQSQANINPTPLNSRSIPDPTQVSKATGFRRQHRVRGRARQHRPHGRAQQMQQNPDALCGIIFVREPLIAKIMFMVVADMARCRPSLSHLCTQYCAVESEGDDCRPRGKKHEDVLKKFRMHECNLLLATSALEEGIDLPRCNLVLRWDAPASYRSHGLCRSRARAPRSTVVVMAEAPSARVLDKLAVYKELDQIISRKCGCGVQNEPPPSEEVYADVFTPLVKAYSPKDINNKADDSKDIINKEVPYNSNEASRNINNAVLHTDVINESDNIKQRASDIAADVTARLTTIVDNDMYSANVVSLNDNLESVNNKGNKNVVIIDTAKEAMDDKGDLTVDRGRRSVETNGQLDVADALNDITKLTEDINKALNSLREDNVNASEFEDKIDASVENNEKSSDGRVDARMNFNVTYTFGKKTCECGSGLCKCKNVISDVRSKSRVDDENCSVDLNTAIALINRYCGKLPSDTFTRLAPQHWTERVRLRDRRTGAPRAAYVCTLRLPLNCPIKFNIVGHPMPTEVLARRMVALQACRILHKSGELDNQLMPIGKENFKAAEPEGGAQSDGEGNECARPGTTKRRQYYYKRTASAFTDCQPIIDSTDEDIARRRWEDVREEYKSRFAPDAPRNVLCALSSRLWCALPERYNTRGRRLHAPQHATHACAVLMAARDDHGLHIPAFPVYTRSGEVRVSIESAPRADVRLSPARARLVRRFMRFVFTDVLRVRRRGMRLQTEGSTHNNYYIVPTVRMTAEDGTSYINIDWSFLELIYRHTEEKKNSVEKPVLIQRDEDEEEEVVEKKSRRQREREACAKRIENPLLAPGEVFAFDAERYRDAVVTPWYRNQDQPQYFLVAEICWNLTPDSAFPSSAHGTFRDYYASKYGVSLTQPRQPLLDVDHTSARLNLLTPRYVNRKGVALPVSSERTRRAKRDRLDQKQILVPELCAVHPFAAPLWFATVALPCVLYRINALLIADEIRRSVGADVALGAAAARGAPPPRWPPLDFGWSLAEVLSKDEKGEKIEKKRDEDDTKSGEKELKHEEENEQEEEDGEDMTEEVEVREKTINDILQEKEDAESCFEIGTWSNDMASSIPTDEFDDYLEPLPPNLTFCTSASGGANWSVPIEKPKAPYGGAKAFSVAESDCSYLSSDFDTDDSDVNSECSDVETDSSGFFSRSSYAAMGVRIEYKTSREAEAVDVERDARVSRAPQPHAPDERRDVAVRRRLMRDSCAPREYIEKYKMSVAKHKKNIQATNLISKDDPVKEILPDTTKEMERLRKSLDIKLNHDKRHLNEATAKLKDNSRVLKEDISVNGVIEVLSESSNCINESKVNSNDFAIGKDVEVGNENVPSNNYNEIEVLVNNERDVKLDADVNISKGNGNGAEFSDNKSDVFKKFYSKTYNENEDKIMSDLDLKYVHGSIKNSLTDGVKEIARNKELLDEIFPFGDGLELNDGQVTLESIERSKRVLLNELKKTLTEEEVKKMNCFSMLDIDIDSPDYVNDKIVNVGFDTAESYTEKVNGFRDPKEFTPYYQDGKGQNGKNFDFDYQPDLEGHPGPSPSVILQALTMSNANDGINLERLETIGDSFLKFAITAYLYCAHPAVHEGKLSHMRSKQVSNLNLYRLGRNKRLGARMIASKFEPHDNWLPPCHRPPPTHHPPAVNGGDQEMQMPKETSTENAGCFIPYNLITQHSIPDKSIADCVEALIGAYLLEMGPRGALLFMSWLGISVLPRHVLPLPADHPYVVAAAAAAAAAEGNEGDRGVGQKRPPTPPPKRSYSPDSLSSSSCSEQSSDEEEEEVPEEPDRGWECEWGWRGRPVGSLRPRRDETGQWVQTVYGELRAPPSPLLRYVEDPEGELERMLSGYDALECTLRYRFRDRSLLLQALTHASHQQNRLTDCYQRLEFLGDAILDYLITRHLYEDARRHSPGALTDLRSALVNNTIFATLAARHGFHKYFRHMSPGLNEVLTKYVKIQEENGHSISEEHYLIQEDEMEQAEDVEVPKALGDLFESVAGAIFLDSGMSLGAVWSSYVRLMGAELEAFSAAAPKSPVRELLEAEPDTAKFGKPERLADGRRVRVCVEVFGRGAFKGVGRNYRIAKGTAARCALRHLRAQRSPRR